jgi:hypothetical protein
VTKPQICDLSGWEYEKGQQKHPGAKAGALKGISGRDKEAALLVPFSRLLKQKPTESEKSTDFPSQFSNP